MYKVILALVMASFLGAANATLPPLTRACIAEAILHEAVFEPVKGWTLVYYSILNRALDSHWKPSTPCGVIWQRAQYSFTLWTPERRESVRKANIHRYNLIDTHLGTLGDFIQPEGFEGVNHYLRCDVRYRVKWWRKMNFLGQVGAHCFYRGY